MDELRENVVGVDEKEQVATSPEGQEEYIGACIVKNTSGVHVRPASAIVKLLSNENCEVSFTYEGKTVNAKSIMSILILGAPQNGKIVICIRGKDPYRVFQKLQNAFDSGFGEL